MLITVLGVLICIIGVALMTARRYLRKEDKEISGKMGRKEIIEAHPPFLLELASKAFLITILGVLMTIQDSSWFFAKQGHQYHILTPKGNKYAVFSSGIKLTIPFSVVQEWQKFVDIKTVNEGESTEGIEGVIQGGIPVRFIDQVTGNVSLSARMQLPSDEVSFIQLVEEFRDQSNLVNNTLLPTVREQVINTGYMFAAQDYISGSAADFRATLDEQLKDGGYSVEKKEIQDTTFLNVDIQQTGNRQIKDIRTTYEVIKRTRVDGKPIRVPHDITKNNIFVSQVIVDAVELESAFKKRLEAQRDISAQKRIEMEKIETAKAEQQRIVAEGERDKAKERAKKEVESVDILITAETKLKQEKTNKELAQIQLQTAKINAEKKKVAAEAKRIELQIADGLSEEQKYKYDIELKKTQAMANALKEVKFPSTVILGNDNDKQGSGLLEALIGAKMAEGLLPKNGGK